MQLSRTPGETKEQEVAQICEEKPFRHQLGSLADEEHLMVMKWSDFSGLQAKEMKYLVV